MSTPIPSWTGFALPLPEATPRVRAEPICTGLAPLMRPRPGPGYLSGEPPYGLTTVKGVPGPVEVRVVYRPNLGSPGDGVLVATTTSGSDGNWRIDDLDPALEFDVVFRRADYNDMILSRVKPKAYPPLELTGSLVVSQNGMSLEGSLSPNLPGLIYVRRVLGLLPEGITLEGGESLTAKGTTFSGGSFSCEVEVVDRFGRSALVGLTLGPFVGYTDPYWNSVWALLHFDESPGAVTTAVNRAGPAWQVTGGASVARASASGGSALYISSGVASSAAPAEVVDWALFADSFTLEMTLREMEKTLCWLFSINGGAVAWGSSAADIDFLLTINQGRLEAQVRNGSSSPTLIFEPGQYPLAAVNRLALVFDQPTNQLRIYREGQLVASGGVPTPLPPAGQRTMRLGNVAGINTALYSGSGVYDEFRLTRGVARYSGPSYLLAPLPFPHS